MNEWLTVMTSSPAPTPRATSATCSAVVQLDTAHACPVPIASANSRSNAATSGPCVTHPDRMARRAAWASCSSIQGRATGIIVPTATLLRAAAQAHADRITHLAGIDRGVPGFGDAERWQRLRKIDRVGEALRALHIGRRALLAQQRNHLCPPSENRG